MPSNNNRLPTTVIAESGAGFLLLRQTDAAAKSRLGVLPLTGSIFAFIFTGVFFLLAKVCHAGNPAASEIFMTLSSVSLLVLTFCALSFLGATAAVYGPRPDSFRFDREGVVLAHLRSAFGNVRKRYRRAGITELAVERIGDGRARGIALYDSGLALALCDGDEETVRDILSRVRALWSLPAPRLLFVNARRRREFDAWQFELSPLSYAELEYEMQVALHTEPLSWVAQGRAKAWARRERYASPPAPTADDDGAFTLPVYPHSL